MTDKQSLYNTVFSLVEEELHHRKNPETYNDNRYDGTNISITGPNRDHSIAERESLHVLTGGDTNASYMNNYIPGKIDAVRHSFHIPLDIAIKGTIARQNQYILEQNKNNK